MKSDIQIAQEATMQPIKEVAASIGIAEDDIELYGKYNIDIVNDLQNEMPQDSNTDNAMGDSSE